MRPEINRPVRPNGWRGVHNAPGDVGPFTGAIRLHGVKTAVPRAKIDGAIRPQRRGGIHPSLCGEGPLQPTRRGDGIHFPIPRTKVNGAIVANGRGGGNLPSGVKTPEFFALGRNGQQPSPEGCDIHRAVICHRRGGRGGKIPGGFQEGKFPEQGGGVGGGYGGPDRCPPYPEPAQNLLH